MIEYYLGLPLFLQIYFGMFVFLIVAISILMHIDNTTGIENDTVLVILGIMQLILLIAYFPVSAFVFAVLFGKFGE